MRYCYFSIKFPLVAYLFYIPGYSASLPAVLYPNQLAFNLSLHKNSRKGKLPAV